jgi:hypothetical protein
MLKSPLCKDKIYSKSKEAARARSKKGKGIFLGIKGLLILLVIESPAFNTWNFFHNGTFKVP